MPELQGCAPARSQGAFSTSLDTDDVGCLPCSAKVLLLLLLRATSVSAAALKLPFCCSAASTLRLEEKKNQRVECIELYRPRFKDGSWPCWPVSGLLDTAAPKLQR